MKTSHVAGTASETPTPAQYKEFFSQVDKGIVTKDRLQDFLRSPKTGGKKIKKQISGFALARDILGDDFFEPAEIATGVGFAYEVSYVDSLRDSIPPKETLEFLREEGFILIAGPPASLSAKEFYLRSPALFDEHSARTHILLNRGDKWSRCARIVEGVVSQVNPGWLALCKVPNSTIRTFGDILALSCKGHKGNVIHRSTSNIAQAMWGFGIYKQLRNTQCITEGIGFVTSSTLYISDSEGPYYLNIAIAAKKDNGQLCFSAHVSKGANSSAFVF